MIEDLLISNINDNHPTCSILIGNFNAKCSKSCYSDKHYKVDSELENIISAGHSQLTRKLTYVINASFFCIDLVFSSNASLTPNCGIEPSIYEKCQHNIIYGTPNFDIPSTSPNYGEV